MHWAVELRGHDGTVWAGQRFDAEIWWSRRHPAEPPRVAFAKTRRNALNKVTAHPSVDALGRVRLASLNNDHWLPTYTARDVLVWLQPVAQIACLH